MFGTLMLDSEGDLIEAVETLDGDDYTTIGIALGSIQVAQAASLRVSTKVRDAWFNRAAGVDMRTLFYDVRGSDTALNPIRERVFLDVLINTPGVSGFEGDATVQFARTGRKIEVKLPCIRISCDNSRVIPAVLG